MQIRVSKGCKVVNLGFLGCTSTTNAPTLQEDTRHIEAKLHEDTRHIEAKRRIIAVWSYPFLRLLGRIQVVDKRNIGYPCEPI